MELSRYTVGVDFRINKSSLDKVDKSLKQFERKLKTLSQVFTKNLKIDITGFTVDQKKLNIALGNALDRASHMVTFQVSKFVVDQGHLNKSLTNAMVQATALASKTAVIKPHLQMRGARVAEEAGLRSRHVMAAGGIGGVAARMWAPALALAGGGYGLASLNERNQRVVSAQLQTQAVVQQAGGTAQEGRQSFDYLRQQANRIGFNYLEAAPDFNKLLSGLTGAGVSVKESQEVFTGFAELARVNKLGKVEQNRLFRALSQVAGKGKLQAEELTGQIARHLALGCESILENLFNCWKLKLV